MLCVRHLDFLNETHLIFSTYCVAYDMQRFDPPIYTMTKKSVKIFVLVCIIFFSSFTSLRGHEQATRQFQMRT